MKLSPFKRVQVLIDFKGHRVIYWSFRPNITYTSGSVLSLLKSQDMQQWLILCPDVGNVFLYTDTTNAGYNKYCTDYYRLHLTVSDTLEYYSDPQIAGRTVCWPYTAKANNLLRLAHLEMSRTGINGIFLKKKTYGLRCPLCTTFDGLQSVNEHCPCCLGTGIKGGYYSGIQMDILLDGLQGGQVIAPDGFAQIAVVQAKCLAWPFILKGDVWVDPARNLRYYIDTASILSKCRNVPLIYSLKMNLLLQTDVIHSPLANKLMDLSDSTYEMCLFDKEFDEL